LRFLEFGSGLVKVIFCLFKVVKVLVWHFFMFYRLALTVGKAIEFWGCFAASHRAKNTEATIFIFCIIFEDSCLGLIGCVAELISKVFL
jgi:hypothetical protein